MKTKFFGVAAILAFLAVMSPASAAVNLITNGSFESGSFSAAPFDTLSAGDPSITGWTIGGDSIDWIGSYWVQGPAAGDRSLDLSGLGLGSISQSFAVTNGAVYTVNFLLAGNPDGGPTVKDVRVTTNGSSQDFFFDILVPTVRSKPLMGWTTESFTFVASGSLETLTFASVGCASSGDNPCAFGPALDLVNVSAVPEASTWAMMLIGFAGIGFIAYRRTKKMALATA